MQKHVNLVKSFPTNIYLQNLASIQKRTSPVKFAHLAEKSGHGSISNLSTKAGTSDHGRLSAEAGSSSPSHRSATRWPIGKISAKCCSFSAVSAPIFARKYAFCSIFQNLPDYPAENFEIWQYFANFATFAKFLLNFTKIADFQTDFLRKF